MTPSERAAFVAGYELAREDAAKACERWFGCTSLGADIRKLTPPASPPAPEASGDKAAAPVCSTCNDTHRMPFGEDHADVMCTRCPTPCRRCRAGGNGPYCATTPCACLCHLSAAFIDGMRPAVERQRAEQYGNTKPAPSTADTLPTPVVPDDVSAEARIAGLLTRAEKAEADLFNARTGHEAMRQQRDETKADRDALRTRLAASLAAEHEAQAHASRLDREHEASVRRWQETVAAVRKQVDELQAERAQYYNVFGMAPALRVALSKWLALSEEQRGYAIYQLDDICADLAKEGDDRANDTAAIRRATDLLRAASAPDSAAGVAAKEG